MLPFKIILKCFYIKHNDGKIAEEFSVKLRIRQNAIISIFHPCNRSLNQCNTKQMRYNFETKMCPLLLFSDATIISVENPKESIKTMGLVISWRQVT